MGTVVWDVTRPPSRTERLRRRAGVAVVLVQHYAALARGERLHS
jgi:hypothetical protein